jgi:hypothetical protein
LSLVSGPSFESQEKRKKKKKAKETRENRSKVGDTHYTEPQLNSRGEKCRRYMPTGIVVLLNAAQIDSAVYTNSYSSKSEAKQTSCDETLARGDPQPAHNWDGYGNGNKISENVLNVSCQKN